MLSLFFLITFMYRVLNLVNRLTVCTTCIKIIMASLKRGLILTVVVMNTPFLVFITSVREVISVKNSELILKCIVFAVKYYIVVFVAVIVTAFQMEVFKALMNFDVLTIRALFNLH